MAKTSSDDKFSTTEKSRKVNIALVSFPTKWQTLHYFLLSLVKILKPLSNKIYLISGGEIDKEELVNQEIFLLDIGEVIDFKKNYRNIFFTFFITILWFIRILKIQLKMATYLIKIRKDTDVVIFYWGYFYVMPLIVSRLLHKKSLMLLTSPDSLGVHKNVFSRILGKVLIDINYKLVDYLIPESENLSKEWKKYSKKILLFGARNIDDNFNISKPLRDRDSIVAYSGRLVKEKGVLNFLESIQILNSSYNKQVKFVIQGQGPLFAEINTKISQMGLESRVTLREWTPNKEMPKFLNDLKLLILPTKSEGLPTIVLESMACGTPVLATSIGGIPDIVKDNETGFILKDDSPHSIAKGIADALDCDQLDEISENAYKLIERKYRFNAAVERYEKIFNSIFNNI